MAPHHVGRPRDTSIEERVIDEAIHTFGRVGWSGFSIEKIARATGAGKASIYLRWASKIDLLVDALDRRIIDVEDLDRGSLRNDLAHMFDQAIDLNLGPSGLAAARLSFEAAFEPAIRPRLEDFIRSRVVAGWNITARAIERGELPEGADGTYIVNTLWGGATSFAFSQTLESRSTARARAQEYGSWLIDRLLTSGS